MQSCTLCCPRRARRIWSPRSTRKRDSDASNADDASARTRRRLARKIFAVLKMLPEHFSNDVLKDMSLKDHAVCKYNEDQVPEGRPGACTRKSILTIWTLELWTQTTKGKVAHHCSRKSNLIVGLLFSPSSGHRSFLSSWNRREEKGGPKPSFFFFFFNFGPSVMKNATRYEKFVTKQQVFAHGHRHTPRTRHLVRAPQHQ